VHRQGKDSHSPRWRSRLYLKEQKTIALADVIREQIHRPDAAREHLEKRTLNASWEREGKIGVQTVSESRPEGETIRLNRDGKILNRAQDGLRPSGKVSQGLKTRNNEMTNTERRKKGGRESDPYNRKNKCSQVLTFNSLQKF